VVAVVGSYRKGGVTDRLVDEMLAEVVAQGHAGCSGAPGHQCPAGAQICRCGS